MRMTTSGRLLTGLVTAALLVAGCGDDSDGESADEGEGTDAPSAEASAFCEDASELQSAMLAGGALEGEEGAAAVAEQAESLRAVEAPDDIADDWEATATPLADFLEASSAAEPYIEDIEVLDPAAGVEGVEGLDHEDPAAVAAITDLMSASQELQSEDAMAAGERLTGYIEENCGEL
jgi:hypothetical protein